MVTIMVTPMVELLVSLQTLEYWVVVTIAMLKTLKLTAIKWQQSTTHHTPHINAILKHQPIGEIVMAVLTPILTMDWVLVMVVPLMPVADGVKLV